MSVEEFLKNLVRGTSLEGLAKKIYTQGKAFHQHRLRRSVKNIAALNQSYDQQTFSIMKKVLTNTSNCIDVGCHKGEILDEILHLAPNGTHIAFEPIASLCDGLKRKYPQVRVYEKALSDVTGTSVFHHVVSNPGYSGLRQRRYDRPNETVDVVKVQTERLDNIVPENTRIDFIKVDVEGAEFQVFKGGAATIKRNKPVIVFEHGLGAADCYGTRPELLFDCLCSECGLNISTLASWLEDEKPLTRRQFKRQFYRGINFYFIAHP